MTTLPSSNPIHKEVCKVSQQCKRHTSPLHHLATTFPIHPKSTEEIRTPCHSPKWIPEIEIIIDGNKEDTVKHANEAKEEVQIFTDRSGYNGGIGATVVLRRLGRRDKILCFHLGSKKEHTVYNGEQVGMILGAELLWREGDVHSVYMGVNNQAAIQATLSHDSHSRHSLTDMFMQVLQKAMECHNIENFKICWVPGHVNVVGNEAVDIEAKKVAEGDMSPTSTLPAVLKRGRNLICLPHNKVALIQANNERLKQYITNDFTSSAHGERIHQIDPILPSGKYAALVNSLPQ